MKTAIFYGSSHGRTRRVIDVVAPRLGIADVFNVKDIPGRSDMLLSYDLLLMFAPTYGDEELQPDMEVFLPESGLDLSGRKFVCCELGNFYGYDYYSFGAMAIMRNRLLDMKATEAFEPLSLDSFPRTDWPQLDRWIDALQQSVKPHA